MARTMLAGNKMFQFKPKTMIEMDVISGYNPRFLREVLPHEVQHAVSPRRGANHLRWLEEGTATMLGEKRVFRRHSDAVIGIDSDRFSENIRGPQTVDLGWNQWAAPKFESKAKRDAAAAEYEKHYVAGPETVEALVRLAGGTFNTRAGIAKVRHLLQDQPVARVPGVLADAIIEQHNLDPSRREALREAIRDAGSTPDAAAVIREKFGIE
jgi:hypothetical protein